MEKYPIPMKCIGDFYTPGVLTIQSCRKPPVLPDELLDEFSQRYKVRSLDDNR